ncbi:MAG: amidase, partial [candidate division NC10 bacterium]|nr:amidase [candidate division NC10 bacterium]
GVDYLKALEGGIQGLRVAWSPDLGYAAVAPEVQVITEAAIKIFEGLGCHVEQADPGFEDPEPIWGTMVSAALGARLGGYLPEWSDRIDPPLVKIIEEGKVMSASQLMQVFFQRVTLWDMARRFFARYDLLLTPTLAVPPFTVGVEAPREIAGRTVARRAWFAFTHPFNLTGQPAASVPCGWTKEHLPVGLHIVGRRFDEVTVLKAAAAFEAASSWADRRPPIG